MPLYSADFASAGTRFFPFGISAQGVLFHTCCVSDQDLETCTCKTCCTECRVFARKTSRVRWPQVDSVAEESNHKSALLHRRRYYASQECQPDGAFFYIIFCRLLAAERRFLMFLQKEFSPAFAWDGERTNIVRTQSCARGK